MLYETFEQWYVLVGYLSAIFFLMIVPVLKINESPFIYTKFFIYFVVIIIVVFALITPFLVEIPIESAQDIQGKTLINSGKIAHIGTFILFYYAIQYRSYYTPAFKYFLGFIIAIAIYSAIELTIVEVLLSGKYQFWKSIFPFLQQFGISDTNFTSPFNYLIKFIFLSLFFRDLFQNTLKKRFFQYLMYALVVFELVMVFVFKSYQGYDSLSSTVKNLFIIGGVSLFLYQFYRTDTGKVPLGKNPYFWISLGLLLPALAEIFLEFIFTKLYQTDLEQFYKLYLFRNASQIVGFTLLIVGIWQAKYLRFLPKEY